MEEEPSIYSLILVRCGRRLSHIVAKQIEDLPLENGWVAGIEHLGQTLRVKLTSTQSFLLLSAIAEFKEQVALIPGAALLAPERKTREAK